MDGHEAVSALTDFGVDVPLAFALIRHGGRCAYCKKNLIGERLAYACAQTDHLFPKSEFPDLVDNEHNWVLSCSVCNRAKWDWVPEIVEMRVPRQARTHNAAQLLENEAERRDLIRRASRFIRRKTSYARSEQDWKAVRKIVRGS